MFGLNILNNAHRVFSQHKSLILRLTNSAYSANIAVMTLNQIRAEVLETEKRLLIEALAAHDYNQSKTAEALGCPATSLRRCLERHPDIIELLKTAGPGRGRPKKDRTEA